MMWFLKVCHNPSDRPSTSNLVGCRDFSSHYVRVHVSTGRRWVLNNTSLVSETSTTLSSDTTSSPVDRPGTDPVEDNISYSQIRTVLLCTI